MQHSIDVSSRAALVRGDIITIISANDDFLQNASVCSSHFLTVAKKKIKSAQNLASCHPNNPFLL